MRGMRCFHAFPGVPLLTKIRESGQLDLEKTKEFRYN
jgi:hypothetical protein